MFDDRKAQQAYDEETQRIREAERIRLERLSPTEIMIELILEMKSVNRRLDQMNAIIKNHI